MNNNEVEVFISHSSRDEHIVKQFTEEILIKGLDFSHINIFSTSIDGTKIK